MKLDKDLFEKVAAQAEQSPRLRMHFDLRDSADEDGQRMMNVLLPGTKRRRPAHDERAASRYQIRYSPA